MRVYRWIAYALNLWFLGWLTGQVASGSEASLIALGPLAAVAIGAGLGALTGGISAHNRDNNVLGGALGGALLGGATGGLGSVALGGLGGSAAGGGLTGVLGNVGRAVLGGGQLLGGLMGGGGGAAPGSAGSGGAGAGALLTSPPFNPAATTGPGPTGIFTPPTAGTGVLPPQALPNPLGDFPAPMAEAPAASTTPATAQAEEENFFQDLLRRLGGRLPQEMGGGRILTEAVGGALNRKELLDTLTEIENARRVRANLNVGVTPGGAAAMRFPQPLTALGSPVGPVYRGGF